MFSPNFKVAASPFVRGVALLMSGTIVAQGVSFVLLIFLQKWYYTPEDFGILSLFTSIAAVLSSISTLKYEYAIILAKDEDSANRLTALCIFFSVTIAMMVVPATLFFSSHSTLGQMLSVHFLMWTLPLIVTFSGSWEALQYWNNRHSAYKRISFSRITQNISMEASRFALIPLQWGGKSLIMGRLIGQIISTLYLLVPFLKAISSVQHKISVKTLRAEALAFKDLPIYTMPTIFLNNLTNWILVYLFFRQHGNGTVGLISVSIQYIAVPFSIISGAFAPVFFKKIVEITEKQVLYNVYKSFLFKLGAIGMAGIVVVYLIPDSWITGVLGEKWEGLPSFMRLTVLWQTVAFVPSALSFIYTRLRKQWIMTVFALVQLIIVYVSLTIGSTYYVTSDQTFLVYVIGQSAYYLSTIAAALYFIRRSTLLK